MVLADILITLLLIVIGALSLYVFHLRSKIKSKECDLNILRYSHNKLTINVKKITNKLEHHEAVVSLMNLGYIINLTDEEMSIVIKKFQDWSLDYTHVGLSWFFNWLSNTDELKSFTSAEITELINYVHVTDYTKPLEEGLKSRVKDAMSNYDFGDKVKFIHDIGAGPFVEPNKIVKGKESC